MTHSLTEERLLLLIPQIPPSKGTYYFLSERFSRSQSITLLGSSSSAYIVEVSFTEGPIMDLSVPIHVYSKHHSYQVFSIIIIYRIYVVFHKPSNFVQSQKWRYFTQKSRIASLKFEKLFPHIFINFEVIFADILHNFLWITSLGREFGRDLTL
jgi:hypothetical protein